MKMVLLRKIPLSSGRRTAHAAIAREPQDFDVAIALDTATQNRLGTSAESVRSAKIWINIDHHPSNPGYGDLVYIDPTAPATGQIVFELIQQEKLPSIAPSPKIFRRDLNRYRIVSISEHDRAHF